jgi:hypothetical protein
MASPGQHDMRCDNFGNSRTCEMVCRVPGSGFRVQGLGFGTGAVPGMGTAGPAHTGVPGPDLSLSQESLSTCSLGLSLCQVSAMRSHARVSAQAWFMV